MYIAVCVQVCNGLILYWFINAGLFRKGIEDCFFSERTIQEQNYAVWILLLKEETYLFAFLVLGFISYYNELNNKLEIFCAE